MKSNIFVGLITDGYSMQNIEGNECIGNGKLITPRCWKLVKMRAIASRKENYLKLDARKW